MSVLSSEVSSEIPIEVSGEAETHKSLFRNENLTPLVSVVIPCYKQAHYLPQAIESVIDQTYKNYEIIVVDDGSPDNTSEVAARYSGVRVIRQKNQGLSAARNTGIRESRGEYLVFLDSDDRLRPKALESGIDCMMNCIEAGLVFGRYHCIHEDGTPYPTSSNLYQNQDIYLGLLKNNFIGMCAAVMYRRQIFDLVGGFDPDINPAADYDLYLRIARQYPSFGHNEVIAEYRIYGTSMSSDLAKMMRAVIIALRSQEKYVKGRQDYEEAYQEGLKFWRDQYGEVVYLQVSRRIALRSEWKRTIRDIWYLLRYYPQAITQHGSSRLGKLGARFRNVLGSGYKS